MSSAGVVKALGTPNFTIGWGFQPIVVHQCPAPQQLVNTVLGLDSSLTPLTKPRTAGSGVHYTPHSAEQGQLRNVDLACEMSQNLRYSS